MPTSPKSQLSIVLLPNNCVMISVFQDGSLPFQYTHKHSSPLRQALHTQIANHHIQWARKSFYFFKVGGFLQSSAQPHESGPIPLQWAAGHIKGTHPPCWFWLLPWESVNKPMNFNCGKWSSDLINYSWSTRFMIQGCPTLTCFIQTWTNLNQFLYGLSMLNVSLYFVVLDTPFNQWLLTKINPLPH